MITAEQIKAIAIECGFDLVGTAPAVPLSAEAGKFREWLDRGYHASMTWMEREPERRTDPRAIFPEARTVISLAMNYYTGRDHSVDAVGKISRYAWGDDYHDVVKTALEKFLSQLKALDPQLNGRVCVDTSAILDKAWAVRAGIGWMGKHSNVISRDIGSWFFIGEVIVDRELLAIAPIVEDHCGTCTACLDACPTQAIVEPYVVDSAKCISFATIELRDENLPESIAAAQSGWLYGCDICQEVCPWNRFEKTSSDERFTPRADETSIEPQTILAMDHNEYVERFRRSAMKRAKLSGLKRNAASLLDADADRESAIDDR